MIWLTWRQLRTQAVTVYAGLLVLAGVLALTGPRLADLYGSYGQRFLSRLTGTDEALGYLSIAAMVLLPALIGMFWGAPLIARELEHGTHRLVWNQSVTRGRWLAVKLGLTELAVVAATGLLCAAVTWWFDPIDKAVNAGGGGPGLFILPRIDIAMFDARGCAPVGYAAFAFALGATLGVLIRRTVAAMAATLTGFTVVQIAVPLWIRPHLATTHQMILPINASSRVAIGPGSLRLNIDKPGAWLIDQRTIDAKGHATALPSYFTRLFDSAAPSDDRLRAGLGRLGADGYRQLASYQPSGNFWTLQLSETALFLALALLLTGFCAWWTSRRLS